MEQARQDAERRAQQVRPVFGDGLSAQPYATPVEKKTFPAVAAVAHAVPVQGHPPALSLGASAGNINLKARKKGSSTMVVPVRRRLRTKTSPAAVPLIPSMGLVRRRMPSRSASPA